MGGVWLRQMLLASRKKRPPAIRQRRRKRIDFKTREGLVLVFGIAVFVALIFVLVYYVWYVPIERSVQ
jgi:hypothetical protein